MTPNVDLMMEAIKAGLILKIVHITNGETETLREVLPIAIGTRNGRIYQRGLHYLGGSASNAPNRSYRLFKLTRTNDIEQDGRLAQKGNLPAGYKTNDSFFDVQEVAFNAGTSGIYLARNRGKLLQMFKE